MSWMDAEEREVEQKIVRALKKLGYPVPEEGELLIFSMKKIAKALEDLAEKKID